MKSSLCFSADFETTTDLDDCRVWAYALSNIENPKEFYYGNCIEGLMDFCSGKNNYTLYFFNLKFDGCFILSWLLENGYTRVNSPKERESKTFTTLITDRGAFYAIEILHFLFDKRAAQQNLLPCSSFVILLHFRPDYFASSIANHLTSSIDLPISVLIYLFAKSTHSVAS